MSLSSALNVSLAGLRTAQSRISVTAANITNANEDGYSRKNVELNTITTTNALVPVGARVEATKNSFLAKEIVKDIGVSTRDDVIAQSLNFYQKRLGSTSGGLTLSRALDDFNNNLLALSATPDDQNAKYSAVEDAARLATEIRNLTGNIQDLRQQAEESIDQAVNEINSALQIIQDLNLQISAGANSVNSNVGDLEDQRLNALNTIAEHIDINYFVSSDQRVRIYTQGGTQLLGETPRLLSFDKTQGINKDTTYPGTLSGVEVGGLDITNSIRSGSMAGNIQLRDETYVEEQAKLESLAAGLKDSVNAALNKGTSLPARPTLTSQTEGMIGADPFTGTGTARIAVLDSNGAVQSYTDLDLTTVTTVSGVVSALDAIAGISASINGDGALEVTATATGNGIAINELDSAVGADSKGFSHYFGFNDLFKGAGAQDISITSQYTDEARFFPTGTLESGTLLAGDIGVSVGDNSIVNGVLDVLNEPQTSFAAAGNFTAQTTSVSKYTASFMANAATRASNADITASATKIAYETTKTLFDNATAVNVDEETAKLLEFENNFQSAATVIGTIRELFDVLIGVMR